MQNVESRQSVQRISSRSRNGMRADVAVFTFTAICLTFLVKTCVDGAQDNHETSRLLVTNISRALSTGLAIDFVFLFSSCKDAKVFAILYVNDTDYEAVQLTSDKCDTRWVISEPIRGSFSQVLLWPGFYSLRISTYADDMEPVGVQANCSIRIGQSTSDDSYECSEPYVYDKTEISVVNSTDHDETGFDMHQFETFVTIVCRKCLTAAIECGCEAGFQNPAFQTLKEYTEQMIAVSEAKDIHSLRSEIPFEPEPPMRVIVHLYNSGIGNQLLSVINGLILSLITRRVLVVKLMTQQRYDFDPVFDFTAHNEDMTQPCRLYSSLDMQSSDGLSAIMCRDFGEYHLIEDCILLENPVQDVHLWLANPAHGAWLNQTFFGLPFFFLSHYLWLGTKQSSLDVTVQSLPSARWWDGTRSVRKVLEDLSANASTLLIGLHVRTTPNVPFLHFEHPSQWLLRRSAPPETHEPSSRTGVNHSKALCEGDTAALDTVHACLQSIVRNRDIKAQPDVVILWASDHETLAQPLLDKLTTMQGVTVVRLVHGSEDRHDKSLQSGTIDVEFLGAAKVFIGSPMSTFSYAAHARHLQQEVYYGSFAPSGAGMCSRTQNSEGGLLTFGHMPSKCKIDGIDSYWSGNGFSIHCTEERDDCLTNSGIFLKMEARCLDDIATCVGRDVEWLSPYALHCDGLAWVQNWAARYGGRFLVKGVPSPYPVCDYRLK